MHWGRVAVAVCLSIVGAACGGPERVCVPGRSEVCVGVGACSGGQRCNDEGTGFGPCECGGALGGGSGSTGGGGGGGADDGGASGGGGGSADDGGASGGGGGRDAGSAGGGGGGGAATGDAGQPYDAGTFDAGPPADIDVVPATTLDLGTVPFSAGSSTPVFVSGSVSVRNLGPSETRLLLGQSTTSSQLPYWTVSALGGASAAEVCVGAFDLATNQCLGTLPTSGPGSYVPAAGVRGGSAPVDLPVRITPAGLGTRSFELKLFSSDPDEPVTTVTLRVEAVSAPPCAVTVAPTSLDFGALGGGNRLELAFAVRNDAADGGTTCLVTRPTFSTETGRPPALPPIFSASPSTPSTFELQPGETRLVPIAASLQGAAPANPAVVSAKARFFISHPTSPLVEVDLAATLASTCLRLTPSATDFGVYAPACNAPARTFQVLNACNTDVTVTGTSVPVAGSATPGSAACPGTSPCPEFQVVTDVAAGSRVLAGATSPATFSLKYRPLDLGPDTGAFHLVTSENGQARTYVVPLRGAANATGLNRDTFLVANGGADVLLVIDDSCSMGDKQTQLGNNMAALLQNATQNGVDFQLGVTNTELAGSTASSAGVLHTSPGGHKILRPSTTNLATEFGSLVRVGTSGYSESCLEPATKALTAPYAFDPSKNLGFIRPNASLAVVCVTDARDQAPNAVTTYLNQLLAIKGGGAPLFTYSVIGPFLPSSPSGCSYDDPNDGRHEYVINATGGVKEEICSTDWNSALQRIGAVAFGGTQASTFPLTARPDAMGTPPVTVRVNGQVVPELSPTPPNARYWSWDTTTNRVVFETYALPAPGSTIEVSYTSACVP